MSSVTPKFRVSYANVFIPKMNAMNGQNEYSFVALFDKDTDLTGLKELAEQALVKKFGGDKALWPKNLKTPFKDQGDKAKNIEGRMVLPEGYVEGAMLLNLKSKQKPGIVNQNREDIIDSSEFYSGCYARASINAYAYDQKGNRGVSFGLNNIQKMADGDPLGGRTRAVDDFGPVAGAGTDSATDLFS